MSIRDERKQQSRQALLDAALRLSASGRSFSAISLREITREVGLVPAAFYRHFENVDQLATELVDQVALHFKGLQHRFSRIYLQHPHASISQGLEYFLVIFSSNFSVLDLSLTGGSGTVCSSLPIPNKLPTPPAAAPNNLLYQLPAFLATLAPTAPAATTPLPAVDTASDATFLSTDLVFPNTLLSSTPIKLLPPVNAE